MRPAAVLACFALLLFPMAASATGEIESLITEADRNRLAGFDAAREEALAEARKEGAAADIAVVDEIQARPLLSFSDFNLTGDWQCRTIKLGGPAPLVIYPWFRCRVTDDGSGWKLEKISGSQRTAGRFFDESDISLTYLGSFFIGGEAPRAYGAGKDTDQVGRALRDGNERWRIEFPRPRYESKFDILEFRR